MTPEELCTWAGNTAHGDMVSIIDKIVEYGAIDLEIMGQGLSKLIKSDRDDGVQAAIIFYLQGKVARMTSALARGEMPSDDTVKDAHVYIMMLKYVREFGHWGRLGNEPNLRLDGLLHPTIDEQGRCLASNPANPQVGCSLPIGHGHNHENQEWGATW